MLAFSAKIEIIGVNPYVRPPQRIVEALLAQAGHAKGPVPVKGELNGHDFVQTLVRYAGAWRLYLNTPMRKTSGLGVGDLANVRIAYDSTPRTVPMPPRLAKALSQDPQARKAFESLTPSRQKEILRYLGSLKKEATLERNVQRVLEFLHGRKPAGIHAVLRVEGTRPKTTKAAGVD